VYVCAIHLLIMIKIRIDDDDGQQLINKNKKQLFNNK
jgi:hypothetical protein